MGRQLSTTGPATQNSCGRWDTPRVCFAVLLLEFHSMATYVLGQSGCATHESAVRSYRNKSKCILICVLLITHPHPKNFQIIADMSLTSAGITRSRTAEFKRRRPAKLQTSWDGGVCICPCVTVHGAPDTSSTTQPRRSPPLVSGLPPYVSANAQQCSRPRTIALLFRWLGGGEMGGGCSASMLFCGEFLG